MPDPLLSSKILVTVIAVLALSALAEQVSVRWAGVLAGYPIGSAIVLFFYGLESGPAFAATCATHNLVGLIASQGFAYAYYRASLRGSPFPATLFSLAAYLGGGFLLTRIPFDRMTAVVAALASILCFTLLLRSVPEQAIVRPVRTSAGLLVGRALLAAGLVVLVTGIARSLDPSRAGLLSAFPVALYPLILLIHLRHGAGKAHVIIRNFPRGLWSVVAYSLTVSAAYPVIGLVWGTLSGFASATLVLAVLQLGTQLLRRRPRPLPAG